MLGTCHKVASKAVVLKLGGGCSCEPVSVSPTFTYKKSSSFIVFMKKNAHFEMFSENYERNEILPCLPQSKHSKISQFDLDDQLYHFA